MRYYKKLLGWENLLYQNRLSRFRFLIKQYSENIEYYDDEVIENDNAKDARQKINLNLANIQKILMSCGVRTTVQHIPPPAIGGYSVSMCLFSNIFGLYKYDIPLQEIFDRIDKALGIYKSDCFWSWLRIFNPLFYFTVVVEYLANIPFVLLGKAGFDQAAIKQSYIGKISELVFKIIVGTSALLSILKYFGILEETLGVFKQLILSIKQLI